MNSKTAKPVKFYRLNDEADIVEISFLMMEFYVQVNILKAMLHGECLQNNKSWYRRNTDVHLFLPVLVLSVYKDIQQLRVAIILQVMKACYITCCSIIKWYFLAFHFMDMILEDLLVMAQKNYLRCRIKN